MTARRHISKKMRLRIHADHGGICCFCKEMIHLDQHRMEISHRIPLAMGGADEERNMEPAHYDCHRSHTASVDIPQIAKAKRVEKKHTGQFRPPRHIVPGSKASPWKRTLRGKTVRRIKENVE